MKRPWLLLSGKLWIAIMMASGGLLGQSQWNSNNCGGSLPTLDRILIDACTSYEPDEYLIFHTGSGPFNVFGSSLSIQVNVTSNPYVSDDWGPNPAELAGMNSSSGCGDPLFLDPFAPPYNGVIPPFSNVLAFVQRDPQFSGSLSGLCGEGAIFVIFGNFSHSFSSSMFGNTCMGCTRDIEVRLGSCTYAITYEPESLAGGHGAYIRGSGSSVYYGNASGCRPEFHQFPPTPAPNLNRESVAICENDTSTPEGFTVTNGSGYTAWYDDPSGSPIHFGTTLIPPRVLFPTPTNGMVAERSLYVANIRGGRPSVMEEILLITHPAPDASGIVLACDPDQDCAICEGEDVMLQVELSSTYGQTFQVIVTDGSSDHELELDGDGVHPFNLPAADQYLIQSVSNEYACTVSEGFGNTEVSIDIRSPAVGYLPLLPDLCREDAPYVLPEMPGGIPGVWTMAGEYLTSVNPATLDVGWTTLDFEPADECAETETVDLEILPLPVTDFDLPLLECTDEYYQPVPDPATSGDGTWTIEPAVAIDPTTGAVYLADLVRGQTYTWTYTASDQCTNSSSAFTKVPECPCEIEIVHETQCNDNGSPTDPVDDLFTYEMTVSGTNTSTTWTTADGQMSGAYNTSYSFGPFPISEGERAIIIGDADDPDCQSTLSIDPPLTCSEECDLNTIVSHILCDDNGSPMDPTDDLFTFDLRVEGQNVAKNWTSDDGLLTGNYDSLYRMGPFPIGEGTRTWTIMDDKDSSCQATLSIDPPVTCSEECDLKTIVTHILCDDNGSPMDPTDDLFTFDLRVEGQNVSENWISDDGLLAGNYDSLYRLGPFPIGEGTRAWAITDDKNSACQATLSIDPPLTCSDECDLKTIVSHILCDDNGSPMDPTDDLFTFDLLIGGQNVAENWTSDVGLLAGSYDSLYRLGPFPISEGTRTWTITDDKNSSCQATLSIDPPLTCSEECELNTIVSHIICEDNGSPMDPTDDLFTFDLRVEGQNVSENWISDDGLLAGNYDSLYRLGPFPIGEGTWAWAITDDKNSACQATLSIDPPLTCSEKCDLKTIVSNILCDDNGSPMDPTDDLFTLDLRVEGQNVSENWTSDDGLLAGSYDSLYRMGPFPIGEGSRTWTITDDQDYSCPIPFTVDPPLTCSDECDLKTIVSHIICDDNGSPMDPTDDLFTFDLLIEGQNVSGNWTSDVGLLAGSYDSLYRLGPFPIGEGTRTWTITDDKNNSCQSILAVDPPLACSEECDLKTFVSNILCDDNGSPMDPTDDLFTFDLRVEGQNVSENWTSDDGLLAGSYDSLYRMGPFPIGEGSRTWTITDDQDYSCPIPFTVDPPLTCSDECDLKTIVSHIICDDNGSPMDPTDDLFTFDLLIGGQNVAENWTSDVGLLAGSYDSLYRLGPFPISEGTRTWSITDDKNNSCQSILAVDPPLACSEECDLKTFISHILCDDNGSPLDSIDDLFTFDLRVEGQNVAENWTSDDGLLAGSYDSLYRLGPFAIGEGSRMWTITDDKNTSCQSVLAVDPPLTCSEECELNTIVSHIICEDNGSPLDPTDDLFTFDLRVEGQNVAENWTSDDKLLAGSYDSLYRLGPFAIGEGSRMWTITDDKDSSCQSTLSIDPPLTCSEECELNTIVSNILCDDNGSPLDSTDDLFTFDLRVEGQNVAENWTSDDGLLAGSYDSLYRLGPFAIGEGSRMWTITDDKNTSCQSILAVDPPLACSEECEISIHVVDSCVWNDIGQREIYYLIFNEFESSHSLLYVFQDNELIDAIEGNGNMPLGPYTDQDINNVLVISYQDHPLCSVTIPLNISDSCHSNVREPPVMDKTNSTFFPNVFSPNQDGMNDTWTAYLPHASQMIELKIFNKWGELISYQARPEIKNGSISWDGTANNSIVDAGLYLYKISWKLEGQEFSALGEILLLR